MSVSLKINGVERALGDPPGGAERVRGAVMECAQWLARRPLDLMQVLGAKG